MLRLIKKIWHRFRDWISQILTPQPTRSRFGDPRLNGLAQRDSLSDTDYEFIFSQLLDGVAHGWHEGRIVKFFEQLGDLGKSRHWVPWLQRFGDKVLASPTPNLQLADRLLRLGSMAQSFSQTAPIGEAAYAIGRQLYTRESGAAIWEYDGFDDNAGFIDASGENGYPLTLDPSNLDPELETITLEELLVRLQGDPDLLQQLSGQLGVTPDNPQAIIDAMIERFQAAQEPLDAPKSPETVAQWFEQALQQAEVGELENAIASWDQALALEPNLSQVWYNRASTLCVLERFDEALTSIENAIACDPNDSHSWFAKGSIYLSLKQWDEALAAWDQVVALKSNDHDAWHNRGITLEQLGRIPDAIASYRRVLAIQPGFDASQERLHQLLRSSSSDSGAIV